MPGLCEISLNYDRLAADENTIQAIYRDFQVARESGLSLNYIQIVEKQIRILEIISAFFCSDDLWVKEALPWQQYLTHNYPKQTQQPRRLKTPN